MKRFCEFTGDMNDASRLLIGVLDNALTPIFLHQFLDSAWHRVEAQYYLCHLYRMLNEPGSREALSRALYNLSMEDILLAFPRLKTIPPLPWSKKTLAQVMRLTGFSFKQFSQLPIYREHTPVQAITALIYSLINRIRYWCIQYGVIDFSQTAMKTLTFPARYFFQHVTPVGTITLPGIINAALAEELMFRFFIQGCLFIGLPNMILSSLNVGDDFPSIPFAFLRIVLQAALFSAVHTRNQFSDMGRFVGGMIYGTLYEMTGNIFSSTIAHIAWNTRVNYAIATADPMVEEIILSSHLDPTLLQKKEREFFHTLKSELIPLSLCLLARTVLCAIDNKRYQDLLSPIALFLLSVTAYCAVSLKMGNQRHLATPNMHSFFPITANQEAIQRLRNPSTPKSI